MEGKRVNLDPYTYDLHAAIRLVEEYGETLQDLVWIDQRYVSIDGWMDGWSPRRRRGRIGWVIRRILLPVLSIHPSISLFLTNPSIHSLSIHPSSSTRMQPGRLDVCECERLNRCPNGTTSSARAKSIYDCTRTGMYVSMYVCMHSMYVSMYVCMCVCM